MVYGEFDIEETEPTEGEEPAKEWAVKAITDIATIPTIVISRAPTGGGESFEPVNLLQKKWKESFLGVAMQKITSFPLTIWTIHR